MMNKKFLFTIFIIAILSIIFVQISSITAFNQGPYLHEGDNGNQGDYKIVHDDSDILSDALLGLSVS